MNQSSYDVIEFGTAQNGKAYALVSMRTTGVVKRTMRGVERGEALDGRAIDGIGDVYVGRGGRPVARVYFAAVVEVVAVVAPVVAVVAPVVAVVAVVAVQLSLFGGAL